MRHEVLDATPGPDGVWEVTAPPVVEGRYMRVTAVDCDGTPRDDFEPAWTKVSGTVRVTCQ